jgi:hypothetical protein
MHEGLYSPGTLPVSYVSVRNIVRTALVLCALTAGVVPLLLGTDGIATVWAFLGVVFGATFAPALY